MDWNKIKCIWKKVWWFIWEDNSIWSWIVNIILAFILIKFLVYPGLGLVLGTSHPIVAVVSSSMEHPENSFDDWWSRSCNGMSQSDLYSKAGIGRTEFEGFAYTNGFNKGDIMILRSADNVKIGDIIVFSTNTRPEPIIHRVIQVKDSPGSVSFMTKGDNNCGSANFEKDISENKVIGRALFKVPLLGWIKIGFVELLKLVGLVS